MNENVVIDRVAGGVAGRDSVPAGAVSEFLFDRVTGAPGSGKTTSTNQIMFAHAKQNRRLLYFTVLGEPPAKYTKILLASPAKRAANPLI